MSRNSSRIAKLFALFLGIAVLPLLVSGQSITNNDNQRASEILEVMEKAEQNQYNVKFVEFCCDLNVQGRILFGKIRKFINEGDIFTRRNLYKSLRALSKLKAIEDVRLENVKVNLNDEQRTINIVYNIRERRVVK